MRIAIIGAGRVGGALGAAFSRAGHQVVYGVRDPGSEKTLAAVDASAGARAATPALAVDGADAIVFALRWPAVPETVAQLPSLAGRVVIDASNQFDGDPLRSTTQDLAELLPGARMVKAFNTAGFENLASATERADKAAMFVAADDPEAKALAMGLASDIGFIPYDAGPLANAKSLEEMVRIWIAVAARHGRGTALAISER